jgi:hypothetical protein
MKDIYIQTQGIKGGNVNSKTVGYVYIAENDNNFISIDAFTGAGDTYKHRDEKHIIIASDGVNVFEGTFNELINLLKPNGN